MCFTGAKSETAQQLKDLLHLGNLSNEEILKMNNELVNCINTRLGKDVSLNTANKLYPNNGFVLEKSFVDTIKKNFDGEVEQVDFSNAASSSKTINDWVLSKTNNKINDLISEQSIDSLLKLVLVNAIYFKGNQIRTFLVILFLLTVFLCLGNWLEKFDSSKTVKEDFNCADGSKVKVDMMKLNGKKFKILNNVLDISGMVCQFPYGIDSTVSMTIFLPNENVKLEVIEKELSAAKIQELLEAEIGKEKVNVSVPKFKLQYEAEVCLKNFFVFNYGNFKN